MIQKIFTLAYYVVLEALRTRFFAVTLVLLMIGFGFSFFFGQITIIESHATESSLLAAFLRLSAVYTVSLFVITSMVREFSDHTIYICLSMPIQRSLYFFGKLSGFTLIALFTATLFGTTLLEYVSLLQVALWTLSLWCELLIIITLSLLCVLTFHQTIQSFSAVLGFYILARSINAIQLMGQGVLNNSSSLADQFINNLVKLLAMLLPNLDSFTQSEWLVYHTGNLTNLSEIIIQTVIYVTLLIAMSLFDLYRKNL